MHSAHFTACLMVKNIRTLFVICVCFLRFTVTNKVSHLGNCNRILLIALAYCKLHSVTTGWQCSMAFSSLIWYISKFRRRGEYPLRVYYIHPSKFNFSSFCPFNEYAPSSTGVCLCVCENVKCVRELQTDSIIHTYGIITFFMDHFMRHVQHYYKKIWS